MPAFSPAELHRQFTEALQAADIDALVALYEPEALLELGRGGTHVGTEAIRGALLQFLALQPRFTMETVSVLQTGDLALTRGKWTMEGTPPGGEPVKMASVSTEVMRRQPDGSWLQVVDKPFAED